MEMCVLSVKFLFDKRFVMSEKLAESLATKTVLMKCYACLNQEWLSIIVIIFLIHS